jgi:hypothetical protein
VFACACAPAMRMDPVRFQAGLRTLGAPRFAELLCREMAESEEAWTRALGDRYESVRHRCARRTTWRSLGLSELLRGDELSRVAVTRRLERWMADGGHRPRSYPGALRLTENGRARPRGGAAQMIPVTTRTPMTTSTPAVTALPHRSSHSPLT